MPKPKPRVRKLWGVWCEKGNGGGTGWVQSEEVAIRCPMSIDGFAAWYNKSQAEMEMQWGDPEHERVVMMAELRIFPSPKK